MSHKCIQATDKKSGTRYTATMFAQDENLKSITIRFKGKEITIYRSQWEK